MPAAQASLSGTGRARFVVLSAGLLALLALLVFAGYLAGWFSSAHSVVIYVIALCMAAPALFLARHIYELELAQQQRWRDQTEARLRESEQRYMELVEQAVTGFVVRRPDGQLILMNEAYSRMTGYSREELLKLNARDMVVDQTVLQKVANLKPGESIQIDTLLKCKGGELKDVQYVTQRRSDGNLQSLLLDLSDRKRVERAREESERRYAELVDQALEGIMVRRPSGQLLFVNDTFCRMLGYTRPELLQLSIRDIVHPEDAETIAQVQQLNVGGQLHLQKRMVRKDGGILYVEVSAKRLKEGDIQTTVHDVSEARLAEQARLASERRYHDLVEQAVDAIWLRDADGRMLLVNEAGCRLLGYSREELMASRSIELIHPSDQGTTTQIDKLSPGQMLRIERVMRRKDGSPVPVEATLHKLSDGSMQVITRDITDRKQAEARERAFMDELRIMSQQLLQAQETERRAIARELHDEVGQSLTATRLHLRDLEQQAADGPLAARLADASTLVAELLGKVRQMSLDLHPSVLDDLGLAAALRWCVRTRAGDSGLEVQFKLPPQLPRFGGMAEITLFRVFQEALSNVLKHSEAKQLSVALRHVDGHVDMTLQDNGKGFDAAAARRHALAGKSLGLVGMEERVRLAGGELALASRPGQGTQIRVSLPATARDAEGMTE